MLIGRDAEWALIAGRLDDARLGNASTILIRGEPGIGKTALVEHACEQAQDMTVLRARGIESEAEIPFSGLLDVLRPVLDALDELPERQASAPQGALALGPAVEGDRFAIGAATLSPLTVSAEERPVLVAIDDAHWLDRGSAEAIAFAARRLEADRVCVLLAVWEDADQEIAPIGAVLELDGLDLESTSELLSHRGTRLSVDELDRVHRLTGGNPLALIELETLKPYEELGERGASMFDSPLPLGANCRGLWKSVLMK